MKEGDIRRQSAGVGLMRIGANTRELAGPSFMFDISQCQNRNCWGII